MGKRNLNRFRITLHTQYGIGSCERKAKDFEDLILNRMSKMEKSKWFELENFVTGESYTHNEWLEKLGVTGEDFEILSR